MDLESMMAETIVKTNAVRRLPSWIEGFKDYTDGITSPMIFRKWAAIGALAAAMERKLWVRSQGDDIYPNLYVVLVGGPGVGKSRPLSRIENMLRTIPELHIAPSSVTTASLVDELNSAHRNILRPGETPGYLEFNSLTCMASELGVFLPAYESSFINILQKLYDGESYSEKRRNNPAKIEIHMPLLSIIGGTTPGYLTTTLPITAWDQGFTSRTIFVYSGESILQSPFSEETENDLTEQKQNLVHDLTLISRRTGCLSWQQEAVDALTTWHMAGGPPRPGHIRLQHYTSRRTLHLMKLCMISAIDFNNQYIMMSDYLRALDWLLEAESFMPDIFLAAGGNAGDSKAIDDAWFFAFTYQAKKSASIPEHVLVGFIRERVPAHSVMRIIEVMGAAGYIKLELDVRSNRSYVVSTRKPGQ